jgi:hypothetical protein
LTPWSFNRAARRTSATRSFSDGRSSTELIRPNWPIASLALGWMLSASSEAFQNPSVQCALNAAIPQSIPL